MDLNDDPELDNPPPVCTAVHRCAWTQHTPLVLTHHITQIFGNRKPNAQRVQCHELLAKLNGAARWRPADRRWLCWLDGEQGDV